MAFIADFGDVPLKWRVASEVLTLCFHIDSIPFFLFKTHHISYLDVSFHNFRVITDGLDEEHLDNTQHKYILGMRQKKESPTHTERERAASVLRQGEKWRFYLFKKVGENVRGRRGWWDEGRRKRRREGGRGSK